LGRGEGDKHEVGDMCTPEGEFAVVAVEDASQWLYDDASGAVEGFYGNYFIRLNSPFKGIGIYGTDDAAIIGTHSTEGSVRLINADLDSLRGLVREGMKVRIDAMDMRIAEARAVITDEKPAEEVAVVEEVAVAQEVQSAEKPAEAQVATGKEVWHKVADGELLGRIAIRYGTTVAEIKRLNPTINVDRISIGQRILVSDGSVAVKAAPKAEEAKAEVVEKDGEVWYTLQPGDLVGRVAMRYGTTTKRIAELNPDINVDKVRDGQRIRVK
jgi:LysM repeat protein